MPMEYRIGNSRADRWADYAASLAACGEDHRLNVSLQDAGGWLIRKRFLCICQHFLTKSPKREPNPRVGRADRCGMLDRLGHQTTIEGHIIQCHVCCSTWPKLGPLHIYERADICPGIPPIATDLTIGHHGAPKRVQASGLHIRGAKVHPSHSLAYLHGVLFCTKCGCYCVKIARGLAQGCKMKPTNPVQASGLKRLLRGEAPSGFTWPELGASVPDFMSPFLESARG